MSNQRYMMRGVSASKEDVHNAIKNIDKGIFPQAFCKIIPDKLHFPSYREQNEAGSQAALARILSNSLQVTEGTVGDGKS